MATATRTARPLSYTAFQINKTFFDRVQRLVNSAKSDLSDKSKVIQDFSKQLLLLAEVINEAQVDDHDSQVDFLMAMNADSGLNRNLVLLLKTFDSMISLLANEEHRAVWQTTKVPTDINYLAQVIKDFIAKTKEFSEDVEARIKDFLKPESTGPLVEAAEQEGLSPRIFVNKTEILRLLFEPQE